MTEPTDFEELPDNVIHLMPRWDEPDASAVLAQRGDLPTEDTAVPSISFDFDGPAIEMGHAITPGNDALPVKMSLRMMNRHGLISGSTGSGKSTSVRVLAEELSRAGVPVFVSDLKGDLAGLCKGDDHPPCYFWSITGKGGERIQTDLRSFGAQLLGRVMGLSDVQTDVLGSIFLFCRNDGLDLINLKNLKDVLLYLGSDAGEKKFLNYGGAAKATLSVLMRKCLALEADGIGQFFGRSSFHVSKLLQTNSQGRGIVNILDLSDIQMFPKLFSNVLLHLLNQLYSTQPERGDQDKPSLVFFYDEIHLLFKEISPDLLEVVENIIRLIRSKGIGVFAVTQLASDIPEGVLGQLSNKIQHAIRAYTPKDRRAIRAAVECFPTSVHEDLEQTIISLPIGQAIVSLLRPDGAPLPTVIAQINTPITRMGTITESERHLYTQVQGIL